MSIGVRPFGPAATRVGRAGSAPGCAGGEGLSGYSDTKAWIFGICDGWGLYGSPAAYPEVFPVPGAGKRSVRVASSERWKAGNVVESSGS